MKRNDKYIIINAPLGARITVLLRGYKILRVRRARYYVFNGIYYRYLPQEKICVFTKRPI